MSVRGLHCTALLTVTWLAAAPSAQSLGDVARRQAELRGQAASAESKKYTNDNLRPVADSVPAAAAAPNAAPPSSGGEAPAAEGGPADQPKAGADAGEAAAKGAPPPPVEKRDEKYWKERSATLRTHLDRAEAKTKTAERRLEQLETALANGAGSSHAQERTVAMRALKEAQQEQRYMQEEWDRMMARAQASNVPSDWLR